MNREARDKFLQFSCSPEATWRANFRDLNAAVTRMATLAAGGRVTVNLVDEEIARLRELWSMPRTDDSPTDILHGLVDPAQLDRFDQAGLSEVIRVCRAAKSQSDAGRTLFAVSRSSKEKPNDADRLRKYLARFGITWSDIR